MAFKRRAKVDLSRLIEVAKSEKKSYSDDRFWKLKRDDAGNGSALIRFLPSVEEHPIPWASFKEYSFQGPTKRYYIEKSLESIGQSDPVQERFWKLWDEGEEEEAKKLNRREYNVSNILVIEDELNPQNVGKVFLFKYGKQIFDMIKKSMDPEFKDKAKLDPFDVDDGPDFRIRLTDRGKRPPTYEDSEWTPPNAVGDEAFLEKIDEQLYDLSEFTDPSTYKSYQELSDKLAEVLVLNKTPPKTSAPTQEPVDMFAKPELKVETIDTDFIPDFDKPTEEPKPSPSSDGDDDLMAMFNKAM